MIPGISELAPRIPDLEDLKPGLKKVWSFWSKIMKFRETNKNFVKYGAAKQMRDMKIHIILPLYSMKKV